MDTGAVVFFTVLSTAFFLILQRTDRGKRLIVLLSMLLAVILIRNFTVYRQLEREGWTGLIAGFVLSFLFWALIGRYNPPRSTNESIQVIGLDD